MKNVYAWQHAVYVYMYSHYMQIIEIYTSIFFRDENVKAQKKKINCHCLLVNERAGVQIQPPQAAKLCIQSLSTNFPILTVCCLEAHHFLNSQKALSPIEQGNILYVYMISSENKCISVSFLGED